MGDPPHEEASSSRAGGGPRFLPVRDPLEEGDTPLGGQLARSRRAGPEVLRTPGGVLEVQAPPRAA
eukprot:5717436-Lingulodinium_polyedra.AAC.1